MMLHFPAATMQRFRGGLPSGNLPESMAGSGTLITADTKEVSAAAEIPADIHEDLRPARGIIIGLLFSVAVWSVIALFVWFRMRR